MSKRGLSDIVTNVLIILLVLVAVSIIWMFLRPVIQGGAGQVEGIGDTFRVSLEIVPSSVIVDDTNDVAELNVKRNAGEGNVVGIGVILEDDGGNSKMIKNYTVIDELGSGKLIISFAGESLGTIVKISVVPIIGLSSGSERIGDIADSQIVGSGSQQQAVCGDGVVGGSEQCELGLPGSVCNVDQYLDRDGNQALDGFQQCQTGSACLWESCGCYADIDNNGQVLSTETSAFVALCNVASPPAKCDCDGDGTAAGADFTQDATCFGAVIAYVVPNDICDCRLRNTDGTYSYGSGACS